MWHALCRNDNGDTEEFLPSLWSLFLVCGGRYPCILHDFLLENLQQVSIIFKEFKMYLHHTLKVCFAGLKNK